MTIHQYPQLHAPEDKLVLDDKASSLLNRQRKTAPSRFAGRARAASAAHEWSRGRWGWVGLDHDQNEDGCARHITDGYPHTLNRHDVGWELPRPTNRQDNQPASQPATGTGRRERDHHDKKRLEGGKTDRPTMETNLLVRPGDAYLQRPKTDFPHLNWRISPASPHMRPSIHHPSTLYHFSGVAPHGGGNPQSWPMPTPPPPVPPSKNQKPSLRRPPDKPTTHPPGISSTRTRNKRVWHSTAANRQGGVGRP